MLSLVLANSASIPVVIPSPVLCEYSVSIFWRWGGEAMLFLLFAAKKGKQSIEPVSFAMTTIV
jgi:hypothetical protein